MDDNEISHPEKRKQADACASVIVQILGPLIKFQLFSFIPRCSKIRHSLSVFLHWIQKESSWHLQILHKYLWFAWLSDSLASILCVSAEMQPKWSTPLRDYTLSVEVHHFSSCLSSRHLYLLLLSSNNHWQIIIRESAPKELCVRPSTVRSDRFRLYLHCRMDCDIRKRSSHGAAFPVAPVKKASWKVWNVMRNLELMHDLIWKLKEEYLRHNWSTQAVFQEDILSSWEDVSRFWNFLNRDKSLP